METKNDLAIISPAQLIVETVQKTGNVTDLKELLAIQKDWEANEARKLFAKHFSKVQLEIEAVVKTKNNSHTNSMYADLSDVIESSKPVYTKEGFAVIFHEGVATGPDSVRIIADVLHNAGHKETFYYDVPMDGVGIKGSANMTKIHAKASSVSYGRRYLMCMIWNIPTSDKDGNTQVLPKITDKQLGQLRDILAAKEVTQANITKLMEYLKLESLEDLMASDFNKALMAVNAIPSKGGTK